jgi:hypothetical protein
VVISGSCECDEASESPVVIDRGVLTLMQGNNTHISPNSWYLLSLSHIESPWGFSVGCAIAGSAEVIELLTGEVIWMIPDVGGALVDWQ